MKTLNNGLWEKLQEADLVQGQAPRIDSVSSPWYVKILLALSGWLGAIFLLGFLLVSFSSFFNNTVSALIISLLLIIIANRILVTATNEFYEHLALASSFAGQILFLTLTFQWEDSVLAWGAVGLLQVALVFLMPSFLHRVFSTLFAALSFSQSLTIIGAPYLFGALLIFPVTWICLKEFSFIKQYKRVKGIMYGLVIAMLLLECSYIFTSGDPYLLGKTSEVMIQITDFLSSIIYISALLFVTWQLLTSNHINTNTRFSKVLLLLTFVLGLATFKAPGLGVGLVVIVLAFAHCNRVMMGLGIIALLFYSSAYYYLIEDTLLFKSGILFFIAFVLFVSHFLLHKMLPLLKDK